MHGFDRFDTILQLAREKIVQKMNFTENSDGFPSRHYGCIASKGPVQIDRNTGEYDFVPIHKWSFSAISVSGAMI